MIAAIMRAHEEGEPILDSRFRSEISHDDFANILRGNVVIPLLSERWEITKEVADALLHKSNGRFTDLIHLANNDAFMLLKSLVDMCPSFDDSSLYKGKRIYFHKRAQLLIEDASQFLKTRNENDLTNVDLLTGCGDYKLPQVLERIGILSYEQTLSEKIIRKTILPHNGEEEIEIRANTVWAIELIREELAKRGRHILSRAISNYVWLLGGNRVVNITPHHRTVTTCY
jgi:hypothetical protein